MKKLIENPKNLQATYQDVFNISDTLPSNDTENNCDILLQPNNNAVQYGRKKGPLSSSATSYYLDLRNQKCHRKG